MPFLKFIWSVISWCFLFLPKAWPYISQIFTWVIDWKKTSPKDESKVIPLPKPENAYKEPVKEEPHISAVVAAPLDEALGKVVEKKSLKISLTGAMNSFNVMKIKSEDEQIASMFGMFSNSSDIKIDPLEIVKNTTNMRTSNRMSSKLLF